MPARPFTDRAVRREFFQTSRRTTKRAAIREEQRWRQTVLPAVPCSVVAVAVPSRGLPLSPPLGPVLFPGEERIDRLTRKRILSNLFPHLLQAASGWKRVQGLSLMIRDAPGRLLRSSLVGSRLVETYFAAEPDGPQHTTNETRAAIQSSSQARTTPAALRRAYASC